MHHCVRIDRVVNLYRSICSKVDPDRRRNTYNTYNTSGSDSSSPIMPSFETEVELAVPAHLLWAAMYEGNLLLPKIAPQFISSIELLEGTNGQVGAISLIRLGTIAAEGAFVKEKLVGCDPENLTVVSTELEGGHRAVGFTKWQPTMKLIPLGADRVKVVSIVEYEYEGDLDATGAIAQAREGFPMLLKGLEGYILSTATSDHSPKVRGTVAAMPLVELHDEIVEKPLPSENDEM